MKMKCLKFITLLVHFVAFPLLHVSSSPSNFPAIFNFGSSCADTGGFSAAFGPIPKPYGMTYFKKPAGRYSDGRLVIDFIAESLGLPFLSPYMDSLGTNFTHGANFASASSTMLPHNKTMKLRYGNSPFDMIKQVEQFLQFKARSSSIYKQGGLQSSRMPKVEYFSKALYTIEMGQNDLGMIISDNIPPEDYIPKAMQQFIDSIVILYNEGARYFWIHNVGPAGCLPYLLLKLSSTNSQLDSAGCSIYIDKINQQFNKQLNETVIMLRERLPLATLILVDIYSPKYMLIEQATELGFIKTLRSCCGYGDNKYKFTWNVRCGYPDVFNGMERVPTVCTNPTERIIWDGIHYTDAAYKFIFNQISGGKFSDPPLGLSMACEGKLQSM